MLENISHPGGMIENSPAFQRWVREPGAPLVPKGRLKSHSTPCAWSGHGLTNQPPGAQPRLARKFGIWSMGFSWDLGFGIWGFSGAWSLVLGAWVALLPPAALATDAFYINNGIVSVTSPPTDPPQIDATNFVNNGLFAITNLNNGSLTPPFPYETWNTLNFSNRNRMVGDSGFRFDKYNPNNSQRSMAANFVNANTINDTNSSIFGNSYVLLSATNAINRGALSVGVTGLLQAQGNNVDLTRSLLASVGHETNPFSGILDRCWSSNDFINFDSNVFDTIFIPGNISSPTQFIQCLAYTPYPAHYTTVPFSIHLGFNYTAFLLNTPDDFNPFLFHTDVLFLRSTNSAITTEVRFFPNYAFTDGGFPNGPYFFQNIRVIQWQNITTNPLTHLLVTNRLYLADTNTVAVNGRHMNLPPGTPPTPRLYPPFDPITARPANYGLTHTFPGFENGLLMSPTNFDFLLAFGDWNLLIEEWATSYSASINATPFVPDPTVQGSTFTNVPGRVEITANKVLDLTRARMDGQSYLKLQSTNHFVGSEAAQIISPISDINLATTNSTLSISNLMQPVVPRMQGHVDVWSGHWDARLVSPIPPPNTSNIFNAEIVDFYLDQSTPAQIQDLTLRGTNLFISDTMNVFRSLLLDTERFTVTTNAPGAPTLTGELNITSGNIVWTASLPKLQYLTNYGKISSVNSVFFGGARQPPFFTSYFTEPYQSFVNHGVIATEGNSTWSLYYENVGTNFGGNGPITVQASTAVLTNGALIATNADISLTSGSLFVSNHVLLPGHALSFTVTNTLDDGSLAGYSADFVTNKNNWLVGDGINLFLRPANSSLLATTITNTAQPFVEVINQWAAQDLGCSPAGYTNNAALGRLILDGGLDSLFTFTAVNASNAIYADSLEFRNWTTNRDGSGNFVGVRIAPNMKVYFAQAVQTSGTNTISIAEKLNGRYGFDGPSGGSFCWVSNFNVGFYSSTNLAYPGGMVHRLNQALVESCNIDSNTNGIVNCNDPAPIDFFGPLGLSLAASMTNSPPHTAVISWNSVPYSTNTVFYKSSFSATNWQVLTNFTLGSVAGRVRVLEPATGSCRIYRVRVDAP
jgi:hypothetical protein